MLQIAITLMFLRVLCLIVLEYRWYFPADFDASAFLSGRRYSFAGWYQIAFYVHIICGPPIVLAGALLMTRVVRERLPRLHRILGRVHTMSILLLLVPSGLVMAARAYAGPVAGAAFVMHGLATGFFAVMAIHRARQRDYTSHARWATRCFAMLCAPLLLRVVNGGIVVLDVETESTYQIVAWVSWLAPLLLYEVVRPYTQHRTIQSPQRQNAILFERRSV